MAELAGLDHIYLTVSDLARSESFYDLLLCQALGCRKNRFTLGDAEPHIQYFHRDFGIVLRPARVVAPHQPYAPGLHHLCLRVDSVAEVQAVAQQLAAAGVAASPASCMPEYAPDYHATYFTDPDGLRLEVTNLRQERRQRRDQWDSLGPTPDSSAPAVVAQRQLDAYNAHDLAGWLACYAPQACQFAWPATLLAQGHAAIRARMVERFADPSLHAQLLRRTVIGSMVIDEETVSRQLPTGPAVVPLVAMYQIEQGLIQSAVFRFGLPQPVVAAG